MKNKKCILKKLWLLIFISAIAFISFNLPIYIVNAADGITDTFYSDSHPEVSSVDGFTGDTLANFNWASKVARPGNDSNDINITIPITYIASSGDAGLWNSLYRSILLFDTSLLDDDIIISNVELHLYGTAKTDTFVPAIAPDANVYTSAPVSNTVVADGDFDSYGSIALCDTAITYANWAIDDWNIFIFNQDGINEISLDGITKLGLRNANYDVAISSPEWSAGKSASVSCSSADGNESQRPKLIISYSPLIFEPLSSLLVNDLSYGAMNLEWTHPDEYTDLVMIRGGYSDCPSSNTSGFLIYTGNISNIDISEYYNELVPLYISGFRLTTSDASESYCIKYYQGGDGMEISHFFAVIPLIIFLIMSLVFYGKGLVHLLTLAYSIVLAFIAATNTWELLFFPICVVCAIIALILFFYSMAKGDWL